MPSNVLTLEQFGEALERFAGRALSVIYRELRDEIMREGYLELQERSPVGEPKQDDHPGKYRASHIPSIGEIKTVVLPDQPSYSIPGEEVVEAALRNSAPTASGFIANAAASEARPDQSYAMLLEGGRRQYTRLSSKTTMWIGSEQAPEGIYGPTREHLRSLRARITASAIRRAEKELG